MLKWLEAKIKSYIEINIKTDRKKYLKYSNEIACVKKFIVFHNLKTIKSVSKLTNFCSKK